MPTYEYRCNACGHEMESFQSIKARPLKKCPACEKNTLERLISGGGAIIFKGSGFYETDYRSKDYTQKAEADKKAASESASKSDGKTDSKTDGKTDGKAKNTAEAKSSSASSSPSGGKSGGNSGGKAEPKSAKSAGGGAAASGSK